MKLEILEIKERGMADERVIFVAKEDCDIGKYFVFVTKKNEGKIVYTQLSYPFWFPDKKVKKGDWVVLYTKDGSSSFRENKDGTTSHFYYRKSNAPILASPNFALLIEANTWGIE